MLPSFLTTLFFALSTVFAQRSLNALGLIRANIGRLVFAFVVLGFIAHTWGGGMGGAGRDWLLLSGVVGMGLGDLAFFLALPMLGSRLTILMAQCLAVPIAALIEWLWLGTTITALQILWSTVILAGVAVALTPSQKSPPRVTVKPIGFLFGLIAALGQGGGAVLSRKAKLVSELSGEELGGFTAAYQRIAGGLLITLAYFAVKALLERKSSTAQNTAQSEQPPKRTWRSYLWIPANAGCGAVLGVSCYQWALFTSPSAIVLPIVACTPLVIVPLAYWIEGERPTRRSLLGGAIAVLGAASLSLAR